jgi:hypothetical protein
MYKECRHILPDGSRCHAAALKDMSYCYHHDRIHRALLRQRSSSKAQLDLPALEDRGSILTALSQVIGALANGRIDGTSAGRVIYALQVAAQFAPAFPKSPAGDPVESITRTSDGDELAPVFIVCEQGDKCSDCPYADECELYENDGEEGEDTDEEDDDADGEEDEDAAEEDDDADDEEDEDAAEEDDDADDEDEDEDAEEAPGKTGDD